MIAGFVPHKGTGPSSSIRQALWISTDSVDNLWESKAH